MPINRPSERGAWPGNVGTPSSLRFVCTGLRRNCVWWREVTRTRCAVKRVAMSTGNRNTPMNAPSLPTPAEIPCPVARMDTGYSSLGMTNVVMFGPNSVKK